MIKEGDIIASNYKIMQKLGSGSFGEIFKALHLQKNIEVAVKVEKANSKHQTLYFEAKVYNWLISHPKPGNRDKYTLNHYAYLSDYSLTQNPPIPMCYHFGTEATGEKILVMQLLGKSLEQLFVERGRRFSIKTVLMAAVQMIQSVEFVHFTRLAHRDIKPDNFAVGMGDQAYKIHIFDFGLSKKFLSSTGVHIQRKEGKNLVGTPRYASISNHMGIEQTRRDDLEALGYIFMYFLRGKLPWQGFPYTKDLYDKIKNVKLTVSVPELCRGYPEEFVTYINYCRNLGFEEEPNYKYVKDLFLNLLLRLGFHFDYRYDWTEISGEQPRW